MRKTKRYVVGFDQDYQTIFGKNEYTDPMTLRQAQRKLRELQGNVPKTVYKLVPVKAKDKR